FRSQGTIWGPAPAGQTKVRWKLQGSGSIGGWRASWVGSVLGPFKGTSVKLKSRYENPPIGNPSLEMEAQDHIGGQSLGHLSDLFEFLFPRDRIGVPAVVYGNGHIPRINIVEREADFPTKPLGKIKAIEGRGIQAMVIGQALAVDLPIGDSLGIGVEGHHRGSGASGPIVPAQGKLPRALS